MLGITTKTFTNTSQLNIHTPDELDREEIEFFTDAELLQLPSLQVGAEIDDNEDYTKW